MEKEKIAELISAHKQETQKKILKIFTRMENEPKWWGRLVIPDKGCMIALTKEGFERAKAAVFMTVATEIKCPIEEIKKFGSSAQVLAKLGMPPITKMNAIPPIIPQIIASGRVHVAKKKA